MSLSNMDSIISSSLQKEKDSIPLLKSTSFISYNNESDPTIKSWKDVKSLSNESDSLSSSSTSRFSTSSFNESIVIDFMDNNNNDDITITNYFGSSEVSKTNWDYEQDTIVSNSSYDDNDIDNKHNNNIISKKNGQHHHPSKNTSMIYELDWINFLHNESYLVKSSSSFDSTTSSSSSSSSISPKIHKQQRVRTLGANQNTVEWVHDYQLEDINNSSFLDVFEENQHQQQVNEEKVIKFGDGIIVYNETEFDADCDNITTSTTTTTIDDNSYSSSTSSSNNKQDNCHYQQIDSKYSYDVGDDIIEYDKKSNIQYPTLVSLKSLIDNDIEHVDSVIDTLYTDIENSLNDINKMCGKPTNNMVGSTTSTTTNKSVRTTRTFKNYQSNEIPNSSNHHHHKLNPNKKDNDYFKSILSLPDDNCKNNNNSNKRSIKNNDTGSRSNECNNNTTTISSTTIIEGVRRTWYPKNNNNVNNPHAPIRWEKRDLLHV